MNNLATKTLDAVGLVSGTVGKLLTFVLDKDRLCQALVERGYSEHEARQLAAKTARIVVRKLGYLREHVAWLKDPDGDMFFFAWAALDELMNALDEVTNPEDLTHELESRQWPRKEAEIAAELIIDAMASHICHWEA